MRADTIGILGASNSLGQAIAAQLNARGTGVSAWSRKARPARPSLVWNRYGTPPSIEVTKPIAAWISVMPIWHLEPYLDQIAEAGATRVLAVSSTSRFTKLSARDPAELATAQKLIAGETALATWSARTGIAHTILQPTLIYGGGEDRNISDIAFVIRKLGCFPVLGQARGLRRPVHVDDLAGAAIAAVTLPVAANKSYVISGGETLTYHEMVRRVFVAMGRTPIVPSVPLWAFAMALRVAGALGLGNRLSLGMAERMNTDMDFASTAAEADLGYAGRPFTIGSADVQGLSSVRENA